MTLYQSTLSYSITPGAWLWGAPLALCSTMAWPHRPVHHHGSSSAPAPCKGRGACHPAQAPPAPPLGPGNWGCPRWRTKGYPLWLPLCAAVLWLFYFCTGLIASPALDVEKAGETRRHQHLGGTGADPSIVLGSE